MEHKPSQRSMQRQAALNRAQKKLRLLASGAMVGGLCLTVSLAMFLVILVEEDQWPAVIGIGVSVAGIIGVFTTIHLSDENDMV